MTMAKRLNAGSQTGSLINHIASGYRQQKPEVGMGVTMLMWTDREPGTITEILQDGKVIVVVEDDYKLIDGSFSSEHQVYEFTPGNGEGQLFKIDRNGSWRYARVDEKTGRIKFSSPAGNNLIIGHRQKYRDPCF